MTVPTPQADLSKKCVCFNVKFGTFRVRRKVSTALIEVDADKNALHLGKDIMASKTLQAITEHDRVTKQYIENRCLPSMMRKGIYMLPIALAPDMDEYIVRRKQERLELVEKFKAEYPTLVAQQPARLRALYDDQDYPTVEALDRKFYLETQMFALDAPAVLKSVRMDLWKREMVKQQEFWKQARQAASAVMRDEFADLVNRLVDRLTPSADGTKKIFKNTLITNFTEWAEVFAARNIAEDEDLSQVVQKVEQLVNGVAPDDLRKDARFREEIAKGLQEVQAAAEKLVIERPRRAIQFDEE